MTKILTEEEEKKGVSKKEENNGWGHFNYSTTNN